MSNTVDETFTRRSSCEERAVPEPPVIGREFEDDLVAVRVDDVAAKAAFGHECCMPHRIAGALQELTGAKCGWNEEPFEKSSSVAVKSALLSRYARSGSNADIPSRLRDGSEACVKCTPLVCRRQDVNHALFPLCRAEGNGRP